MSGRLRERCFPDLSKSFLRSSLMNKKSIIVLAATALVSLFSFTGCGLFGSVSEIEVVNGYTAVNEPSIETISVTGEDGSVAVDNYQPVYESGFTSVNNLPAGCNAATYVYVREAKKYTVTVTYKNHGSNSPESGTASADIEVTTVGENFSLLFADDSEGNPSLTVQ